MVERVFLDWDEPFLGQSVRWLLERQAELPEMCVVVPTAQSGRRLREALAESAGALLTPKIVTPGWFLKCYDELAAPDWMEQVAWTEVLEGDLDWSKLTALFPEPEATGETWSSSLSQEMVALRHALQENGLLLSDAASCLQASEEAERWQALAHLESLVEAKLESWDLKSRSRLLARGIVIPPEFSQIVLSGITEIPPILAEAFSSLDRRVTALIAAPRARSHEFSALGCPLPVWDQRALPSPNGSLGVVADGRQQAAEALRLAGHHQTQSNELALGAADADVGEAISRTFTRAGWPAFHPAAPTINVGLQRWFQTWNKWMAEPTFAKMTDLLALPESSALIVADRAKVTLHLCKLRDAWMVTRTEDLQRKIESEKFRTDRDRENAEEVYQTAEVFARWRARLLQGNFLSGITELLEQLAHAEEASEQAEKMLEWLENAAPLIQRVQREPSFWLRHMVAAIPPIVATPPDGRVIDVQGWLELFYEPGLHLVLCGMNEGSVPGRLGGEPWLSAASRDALKLIKDSDRAARDAYLYVAMLEARRRHGRADVLCGKTGSTGDPLLPSRLLLATDRQELPERVKLLFREVEPPEAGLRWHKDFVWSPREQKPRTKISVSSLATYLKCPLRYYLKHVLGMNQPEMVRSEWNARDFGNVAHEVLERWGGDSEARNHYKSEPIRDWLSTELDRIVAERFGKRVPLAVRIQTESLRQRFVWFSEIQAADRSQGWEIVDVEREFKLPIGDVTITGKIDRVDRNHESGQYRVIDYKTGIVKAVSAAHRGKITKKTELPPHFTDDCPAIYEGEEKGKSTDFYWKNLQLPMYALAMMENEQVLALPAYFTVGNTVEGVKIHNWDDFQDTDLEAASACAQWVVSQIQAKVFWPPAAKVSFDDFSLLAAGRSLEEMFNAPVKTSV